MTLVGRIFNAATSLASKLLKELELGLEAESDYENKIKPKLNGIKQLEQAIEEKRKEIAELEERQKNLGCQLD